MKSLTAFVKPWMLLLLAAMLSIGCSPRSAPVTEPVTVQVITERLCGEFEEQNVEALLRTIDPELLAQDEEAIRQFRVVENNERRRIACMEEDG